MSAVDRPRVLVAEDHLPLRDLLVRTLQECGYKVGTTMSCAGLEYELVASHRFEAPVRLVMADTSLIDGPSVRAVVRARAQGWRGSAIFVAPFAGPEEKAKVRAVKHAILLDQPFDPRHVRAVAMAAVPIIGLEPAIQGFA